MLSLDKLLIQNNQNYFIIKLANLQAHLIKTTTYADVKICIEDKHDEQHKSSSRQ